MDSQSSRAARAASRVMCAFAAFALVLICFASSAPAQTQPQAAKNTDQNLFPVRQTVFLQHVTNERGLNDITTDLRNLFPRTKIYGVASQRAISLAGTQEDVDAAQKLIADLDRPVKTYRITYTLTENGSGAGGQKYVVLAAAGQHVDLVVGTKVPILTSAPEKSDSPASAQFQYIDVGLKIRATPDSTAGGVRLESRVEQSSVAGQTQLAGAQEPTLNQTVLNATAMLTEGKPQVLGSLDVPGASKRLEVSVVAEEVK